MINMPDNGAGMRGLEPFQIVLDEVEHVDLASFDFFNFYEQEGSRVRFLTPDPALGHMVEPLTWEYHPVGEDLDLSRLISQYHQAETSNSVAGVTWDDVREHARRLRDAPHYQAFVGAQMEDFPIEYFTSPLVPAGTAYLLDTNSIERAMDEAARDPDPNPFSEVFYRGWVREEFVSSRHHGFEEFAEHIRQGWVREDEPEAPDDPDAEFSSAQERQFSTAKQRLEDWFKNVDELLEGPEEPEHAWQVTAYHHPGD